MALRVLPSADFIQREGIFSSFQFPRRFPDNAMKMAEQIELWPVEKLKPYSRNPRTHTPEQVAKIAASISEFGFTNPILVDANQGLIAGHCRLMAAQKLGLKTVPLIELTHLTEAQKRAYVIADNRLALDAGWDMELLAGELAALKEDGFDLELTGFSGDEINEFLTPESTGLTDDDAAPPMPEEAITVKGDVWFLATSSRMRDHCPYGRGEAHE